jgi:hypothetical protein
VDISLSLADTLRVRAITLADVGAELARGGAVRGSRLSTGSRAQSGLRKAAVAVHV